MDYSSWLCSSVSVDRTRGTGTLCLFDDSPVREIKKELHNPNSIETGILIQELNRVNGENKRLTEMLTVVCENYNELKRQLTEYMSKSASNNNNNEIGNVTKKRKVENNAIVAINSNNNVPIESCSSDEEISGEKMKEEKMKEESIQAKITRVAVRTEPSDLSLILKDGYQWRKYGQKVTRDNPCPRAYFKCSFAPTCPVKKKVQRSLEDQTMLVATYEGEHNHTPLQQDGSSPGANRVFTVGPGPCNATLSPSVPTMTIDLTKPKSNLANDNVNVPVLSNTGNNQLNKFNSGEFQKLLAEHMASSLTKDPSFTSALAAAISGRIAHQSPSN